MSETQQDGQDLAGRRYEPPEEFAKNANVTDSSVYEKAEQEQAEGLQTDYDEIYVRSLTGITNVEKELRDATPTQEPRHT